MHAAARHEARAGAAPPALARRRAGLPQRLVLEEAAVGDGLVDAHQVLLDDRARAEVQVADLGVAHLAVGQADGAARRRSAACAGSSPTARRTRACRQARSALPGPGGREPPAVEHHQRDRAGAGTFRASGPRGAAATMARTRPGRGCAAHQRAVHVGLREQLGRVAGVDAAAVEDRACAAPRRCRGRRPARARRRSPPAPAPASPSCRCRSPRSARRRSRRRRRPSAATCGQVGLHLLAQLALQSRRRRALPRSRRRRGSVSARPPAPPAPCAASAPSVSPKSCAPLGVAER